jgi:DNA topoisomerase-2
MYLFNSKCQIQKYERPVDIIRDFYVVRLRYYQTRKDQLLAKLEFDIDLLKNKIRFILECVAEAIKVHKMKKAELVTRLEEDKYMLHDDSYDYILRIPIYNLTIDKVEELEAEMKKAQDEIDRVRELNVKDWWIADLDAFVDEYKKMPLTSSTQGVVKKQVLKKKN